MSVHDIIGVLPNVDRVLYARSKKVGYGKKEYKRNPVRSINQIVELGYFRGDFTIMTEDEVEEIIEKFNTDREFRISRAFLDGGPDNPSKRLQRAALDQLCEDRSTISRYGIWANTVRDNIRQADVEIENGNLMEARRFLRCAANSLSAFAELQAQFDAMGNR